MINDLHLTMEDGEEGEGDGEGKDEKAFKFRRSSEPMNETATAWTTTTGEECVFQTISERG